LIVIEATGGLEVRITTELAGKGLQVAVINRAKRVTLPRLQASWPRRIRLMLRYWRRLPKQFDRRPDRSKMRTPAPWTTWLADGGS